MSRPSSILTALIGVFFIGTQSAQAQEGEGKASVPSTNIEKIQVTGSHIKRINIEGPSPVQILDREDLKQSGYNSISDVLRDISASSFGAPREASGGGAEGVAATVSLRGLGPDRTLVLLNGKRISIGPADLNLLSMAAVERIEILKDGASATYGSDALGGVVNIITRKDYQGFRFEVQQSATELKGGQKGHFNFMTGHNTRKFSSLAVLSYKNNDIIYDRDRKWTYLTNKDRFSTLGNPGSFYNTTPVTQEDGTIVDEATGLMHADPECPASLLVQDANGEHCAFNWSEFSTSLPEIKQLAFLGDSTYEWSPGHKIFSRLSYVQRQVKYIYASTPDIFNIPNPGNLPDATSDPIQALYRLTDLGDRVSELTSDVFGLLLGTSGEVGASWEWTAEANIRQEDTVDRGTNGFARKDVLSELIATGVYSPFAAGDKGDVSSAAHVSEAKDHKLVYNLELKAAGEIMDLQHGPLNIAVGTVGSWEEFETTVDDVTKAGNLYGGAGTEGEGSRNIQSLYTELSANVLPNLEVQWAGRIDHYNDFGTTANPKLALRWQVRPDLLIRSSAGTGFRAPTTDNLHAGESYGYPTFIDHVSCDRQKKANGGDIDRGNTPDCFAKQYKVRSDGNKDLEEEKSTSYNIGAVYQPTKNLSFGLDLWKMQIKNSIGVSYGAITQAEFAGSDLGAHGIKIDRSTDDNGTPDDPSDDIQNVGTLKQITAPLLNLSQTDLSGLDLVGEYNFRAPYLSKTKAQFRLESSVLFEYKETPFPGSVTVDEIDMSGSPQWKSSASLALSRHAHSLYLLARTIAGQEKEVREWGRIPEHTEWDLQYKYSGEHYGAVTVGVKNLFGDTPPIDDSKDADQGNTDLYEEVGRYVYVNYSYEI